LSIPEGNEDEDNDRNALPELSGADAFNMIDAKLVKLRKK